MLGDKLINLERGQGFHALKKDEISEKKTQVNDQTKHRADLSEESVEAKEKISFLKKICSERVPSRVFPENNLRTVDSL